MAADGRPGGNDGRVPRPPRLGRALLATLVPGEFRDEIAGDLTERFARRARADGRLRAHVWYWGQIVRMRPWALRRAAAEERRRRAATPYEVAKMWMWTGWSADVRQAVRGLRARIGFSATVTLTVALATGASTSIFSVVNGVLLRPLDYPEPDRLVRAWQTRPSWMDHPNRQLHAIGARSLVSVPTFNDWASARTGFESLGIYRSGQWVHESAEGAELLRGLTLTSGVFEALGVEPHLGRHLVPGDDEVGAPSVAVLSHAVWRDRFGGDRALLGRTLSLDGTPHVVVRPRRRHIERSAEIRMVSEALGHVLRADPQTDQAVRQDQKDERTLRAQLPASGGGRRLVDGAIRGAPSIDPYPASAYGPSRTRSRARSRARKM